MRAKREKAPIRDANSVRSEIGKKFAELCPYRSPAPHPIVSMRHNALLFFGFVLSGTVLSAQRFTAADSLRGMLRPERLCYDVRYYDLNVEVDITGKRIKGCNTVHYATLREFNMLQMDLFANMQIDSILHGGRSLAFYRKHNAFFVDFGAIQPQDRLDSISIYYQGSPTQAVNPPWDGGFTWNQDRNKKPFVGVSCEGIGASLWWPNKDHLSDEPDSMRIRCTVPPGLFCVSNGVLRSRTELPDSAGTCFEWAVSYPINNYNVTLNIADYVHFSDTFTSPTDGSRLPLDYYVLPYNLNTAKKHFGQVHRVLAAMEKYLDKYPFWNDGYALVETPYLGMEHQGAIAYGNRYLNGYLGRHIPQVPDDFIILHESAHEWWGNSVSCFDLAEMWIHEAFTTYMEAVYVEEYYGYETAVAYLRDYRNYITNLLPMVGPKDVNFKDHDTDIYYKGALMLHVLRGCINNDALWWDLLKSFYRRHSMGHARSEDFAALVAEKTGKDYAWFFNQYLYDKNLPILELKLSENKRELFARWQTQQAEFPMPVTINKKRFVPGKEWTAVPLTKFDPNKLQFDLGLFALAWKLQ